MPDDLKLDSLPVHQPESKIVLPAYSVVASPGLFARIEKCGFLPLCRQPINAVFEINDGEHHDHLVDIATGKVVEFYDEVIERRQKEIASQYNFTITEHTMILYGRFDDEAK